MTTPVKLDCKGVWKLYGPRNTEVLAAHGGRPSADVLEAAGLVGAVRDANVQIRAHVET